MDPFRFFFDNWKLRPDRREIRRSLWPKDRVADCFSLDNDLEPRYLPAAHVGFDRSLSADIQFLASPEGDCLHKDLVPAIESH